MLRLFGRGKTTKASSEALIARGQNPKRRHRPSCFLLCRGRRFRLPAFSKTRFPSRLMNWSGQIPKQRLLWRRRSGTHPCVIRLLFRRLCAVLPSLRLPGAARRGGKIRAHTQFDVAGRRGPFFLKRSLGERRPDAAEKAVRFSEEVVEEFERSPTVNGTVEGRRLLHDGAMDSFLYICPLFVCERACIVLACAGLACVLAWISIVDVQERIIPHGVLLGAVAIWCMLIACTAAFGSEGSAFRAAAAGIAGAFALGAGSFATSCVADVFAGRETFGAGDVKLLFVVGLFSGAFWGAVILVLACVLLLAVAFVRACRDGFLRRHPSRKDRSIPIGFHGGTSDDGTFPFAPFVAVAVCAVFAVLSCAEGVAPMA